MALVLIPAYVIVDWFSMTQLIWHAENLFVGLVLPFFFTFIGPIVVAGCICALGSTDRTYPFVVVGAVAFGILLTYAHIRFILLVIASV